MQSGPAILFRGFEPREDTRNLINYQIEQLERRCQRITSLRIAVDSPRPQKSGGAFDVRIDIVVPGDELAINHHPGESERKDDVDATIRDAFRAANRRLLSWASRRRGRAKAHRRSRLDA